MWCVGLKIPAGVPGGLVPSGADGGNGICATGAMQEGNMCLILCAPPPTIGPSEEALQRMFVVPHMALCKPGAILQSCMHIGMLAHELAWVMGGVGSPSASRHNKLKL